MVDMEVMIPSASAAVAVDFNFDSACTSPYTSTPSSPQRFGNFFFSAPTSPIRASAFYSEFNSFYADTAGATMANSGIPFSWEEKAGTPQKRLDDANNSFAFKDEDTDFAFDFSGLLERTSLSAADELFDGGKIKPLKPPPRLQYPESRVADSPKSPKTNKNAFREAFSPRQNNKDVDPFATAIEQTRRDHPAEPKNDRRGRERTNEANSKSTSRHKAARYLSPFRVSDLLLFDSKEDDQQKQQDDDSSKQSSSTSGWASNWYRNWKLKDLFLFRSASEGRAVGFNKLEDPIKKYGLLKKSHQEDVKNSSFRSVDSCGSTSTSRRRGPVVSAHELHYTKNRAVSEEMRKKTFLPYKPALLGCLSFTPAVHDISKSFTHPSSFNQS